MNIFSVFVENTLLLAVIPWTELTKFSMIFFKSGQSFSKYSVNDAEIALPQNDASTDLFEMINLEKICLSICQEYVLRPSVVIFYPHQSWESFLSSSEHFWY